MLFRSNVKVPKPVDKVVSDKDLKAADAVFGVLYKADDVTVTSMQRLMSAGLLGEQKNRRLVPTRWAITAVDDIIGKGLVPSIHNLPEIDKYYTFFGEYLDNKFMVLFAPGQWKYEMNECWNASTLWNQPVPGIDTYYSPVPVIINDFELEYGRKNYAGNVTGAYYAARKEIEEFLFTSHRQASVIVFREVAGGYIVPLGVWVIRETVKKALAEGWKGENVRIHETLKDAVNRLREVFEVPVKYWLAASNLIRYMKTQYKLDRWIK